MTRVTVTSGNGKLTIEVANHKATQIESTFGTSCRLIKEANAQYETDGNYFEYLSRIQFAINLCSPASTKTLLKLVKYGN